MRTSLSTHGRVVANKKSASHRQLWIATSRAFHKSPMPFELSVLAEASMDVHSITVDNDTSVEDIKVRKINRVNCCIWRHPSQYFLGRS
jgi:hypothetical protein